MRLPAREEAGMPRSPIAGYCSRSYFEALAAAGDSTIFVATISPWFFL